MFNKNFSLSFWNFNNSNNKRNSGPRLFLKQQENPPDLLLSSQNSAILLETLLGSYMTIWNSRSQEGFVFSHMQYRLFFFSRKMFNGHITFSMSLLL